MKAPARHAALAGIAAIAMTGTLLAADALTWPWKDKGPNDPALALLTSVEDLSVVVNDKSEPATVAITVKATAPTPGFTELQLAYRLGDTEDLKFEFDARGRPPQDVTTEQPTSVTISAEYADAPLAKLAVIEVYAKDNCMGFSIKDKTKVDCKPRPATAEEAK